MDYIRSHYNSLVKTGARFIVDGQSKFYGKTGRILSATDSARLRVLLDGEKRSRIFHPIDLRIMV